MKPCIICNIWTNFESLYVCDKCLGDSRKIDNFLIKIKILLNQVVAQTNEGGLLKTLTRKEICQTIAQFHNNEEKEGRNNIDEATYAEQEGLAAAKIDNWPRVVFWALRWLLVRVKL